MTEQPNPEDRLREWGRIDWPVPTSTLPAETITVAGYTPTPSPGASGAGEVPLPEPWAWLVNRTDGSVTNEHFATDRALDAAMAERMGARVTDLHPSPDVKAYGDARAAHAAREARAEERARVVAWLRGYAESFAEDYRAVYDPRDDQTARATESAARAIERGDHTQA